MSPSTAGTAACDRCESRRAHSRKASQRFVLCGVLIAAPLLVLGSLEAVFRRTAFSRVSRIAWSDDRYDGVWRRHPQRWRSLHAVEKKKPGAFRIVALGDSFTWGDKIPRTADTWPYVVESSLQEEPPRVEVHNLGQCGFTTVNEAELLERAGWALAPDLLVIAFTLNDPLPGHGLEHTPEQELFPTLPLALRTVSHDWLLARSNLYAAADRGFRELQFRARYRHRYRRFFDDDNPHWQACVAALDRIGSQARARGVPALLALFPVFTPAGLDEEKYAYLDLHRKVIAAAEAAGLAAFDLRPLYLHRPPRDWWVVREFDSHPSVEAQRVAGEAIARRLAELGWVGRGKTGVARDGTPVARY